MSKTMSALVFRGKNRIEYTAVPIPWIGEHDVLMQIKSVGICGTDLHIYRGGLDVPAGTIPGHEFSGVVAEVGKRVKRVKPGDRVVGEHVVVCHRCAYCLGGKPNLCVSREIIGVHRPGALAEYVSLPEELVYSVPDEVSFDEAAMIEPLSIALYSVREAGFLLNKRVGVIGQGPIGLLVDQVLSAAGALVTGLDVRDTSLEFAKQKGWAHHVINTKTQDTKKRMAEIGSSNGFDIIFEVVGIEQTAELSFDIARSNGLVILLGVFSSPARINLMNIVKKELNVRGSWTCAFSFPDSIDLVARGKVDLKSLVTHRYAAKDGARAFAEAESYADHRIKTIIYF